MIYYKFLLWLGYRTVSGNNYRGSAIVDSCMLTMQKGRKVKKVVLLRDGIDWQALQIAEAA